MINLEIECSRVTPRKSIKIASECIRRKLQKLGELIGKQPEKVPLFRNELRVLFPQELTVDAHNVNGGIGFRINGNASPFNLLLAGNVQLSITCLY